MSFDVLLLAGGFGTRIEKYHSNTPKALLKITKNETILDILIEKVKQVPNLEEIHIVSNNKYFSHFEKNLRDKKIIIHNNGVNENSKRLGTIGDIIFFLDRYDINKGNDLLIVLTDNLFEENLNNFFDLNKDGEIEIMTYDCKSLDYAKKMGTVITKNNYVDFFEEKPNKPKTTVVSTGIYFFPNKKIDIIRKYVKNNPERLDCSGYAFEWIEKEEKILVYTTNKKWFDVGDINALEKARLEFKNFK